MSKKRRREGGKQGTNGTHESNGTSDGGEHEVIAAPESGDESAEAERSEAVREAMAEAVEELLAEQPTRYSDATRPADPDAEAAAELDEEQPTRTGRALEAAPEDAAAEFSEDELTKTAARGALRSVTEGEGPFEQRFDFGDAGGEAPASVDTDEVPPEPGSAETASPRLQSIVESLLFAADRPLALRQLAELVEETEVERIRGAVLAIEQSWRERGVQLHEVAGGYQFRTHPANAVWVQKLLQQKPVRLSRALLETLAIVSYRQPITRPEIDEIRGVDSGGTLKTLMDRALVRILGKKEEVGRPLLYGTTKEFLEFFSLRDLKDLPTLREYHELSEEHQAQVAALEGAAPEGSILAEGEVNEDELTEALPKLSRLEIAAPKEDAAELAEIDRLIRTAGASIATDEDIPTAQGEAAAEPVAADAATVDPAAMDAAEDLVTTGRFEAVSRRRNEAVAEFDEERARTGTFGDPLLPASPPEEPATEFEAEEATRLRGEGLDAELVDGRDPDKEPVA